MVIPVFNGEEHIKECLLSVSGQTYVNLQIIVVDDGSIDKTPAIVSQYQRGDPRVEFISLGKNSGTPSVPRNIGCLRSDGRYIAFLDADDLWHPNKIELQVRSIENSEYFMCSTGAIDFVVSPPNAKLCVLNGITRRINLFDQMVKYRTPTSSIVIKREFVDNFLFDERKANRGREDLIFSLLAHAKYGESIKYLSPLVYYRKHQNQISSKKIIMMLKTFWILFSIKLPKKNWYKIFFFYFVISNLFYSLKYRVIEKRL